jgi:hypothetical protein
MKDIFQSRATAPREKAVEPRFVYDSGPRFEAGPRVPANRLSIVHVNKR